MKPYVFAKTVFRGYSVNLYYLEEKSVYFWTTKNYGYAMDIGTGKLCFDSLSEALLQAKELGLKVKLNKAKFTEEQLTHYQRMV